VIYRFNTRRGGGPDLRTDHVRAQLGPRGFDARRYLTRYTMDELLCMGWGAFALLNALRAPDPLKAAARGAREVRKMFPPRPPEVGARGRFRFRRPNRAGAPDPEPPARRDTIHIRKQPRARGLIGGENA